MSPTAPIRFFVLLSVAAGVLSNSYIADQIRLSDDLFGTGVYSARVVPNVDANTPVNVTFGFTLLGFDLDEEKNTLFTNAWIHETWNDTRLRWTPSKYGGIDKLYVPHYQVYRPDTSLYNSYGSQDMHPGTDENTVLINSSGVVLFFRHVGLKSGCEIVTTRKEQTCILRFGSWARDALTLDYQFRSEEPNLRLMVPHPKWELTDTELSRAKQKYDCCPEPYVDITVKMRFSKKISKN